VEEELYDIEITQIMIAMKLEGLRDDKAGGADEKTPRYLNKIKDEISYPLTIILIRSWKRRKYLRIGKRPMLFPYTSEAVRVQ